MCGFMLGWEAHFPPSDGPRPSTVWPLTSAVQRVTFLKGATCEHSTQVAELILNTEVSISLSSWIVGERRSEFKGLGRWGEFWTSSSGRGMSTTGPVDNEWRSVAVKICNGMQLSKSGCSGPSCIKVGKLQAFSLYEACLLLDRIGKGVKLDILYKTLLDTQNSQEERVELQLR